MAIVQQFSYTFPDGTVLTNIGNKFNNWMETLSVEEKKEFRLADIRQKALRQSVIDSGNLTLIEYNTKYLWKDEDSCSQGKPEDEIWIKYFIRFLQENNIKFEDSAAPN